ncbi:hypothetical protein M501DRAFT_1032427 [Patellaria atrata CBS 101060]|uniref:Uncharacterized protein n=1 Tax=Patellaria atrata CBS 101060 TaxID=1346257 RepID=A0A9P4S9N5_9PEZI|nr:hypothetical protein M501DRAFT_1032427 [Patellaria atrata CBS 101060]
MVIVSSRIGLQPNNFATEEMSSFKAVFDLEQYVPLVIRWRDDAPTTETLLVHRRDPDPIRCISDMDEVDLNPMDLCLSPESANQLLELINRANDFFDLLRQAVTENIISKGEYLLVIRDHHTHAMAKALLSAPALFTSHRLNMVMGGPPLYLTSNRANEELFESFRIAADHIQITKIGVARAAAYLLRYRSLIRWTHNDTVIPLPDEQVDMFIYAFCLRYVTLYFTNDGGFDCVTPLEIDAEDDPYQPVEAKNQIRTFALTFRAESPCAHAFKAPKQQNWYTWATLFTATSLSRLAGANISVPEKIRPAAHEFRTYPPGARPGPTVPGFEDPEYDESAYGPEGFPAPVDPDHLPTGHAVFTADYTVLVRELCDAVPAKLTRHLNGGMPPVPRGYSPYKVFAPRDYGNKVCWYEWLGWVRKWGGEIHTNAAVVTVMGLMAGYDDETEEGCQEAYLKMRAMKDAGRLNVLGYVSAERDPLDCLPRYPEPSENKNMHYRPRRRYVDTAPPPSPPWNPYAPVFYTTSTSYIPQDQNRTDGREGGDMFVYGSGLGQDGMGWDGMQ